MTDIKATNTRIQRYQEKQSIIKHKRDRLMRLQVILLLFCSVFFLSLLLSFVLRH